MTLSTRLATAVALACLLAPPARPAGAAPADDRGDEVVAECAGRRLTRRALGQAVLWRMLPRMKEAGSTPLMIFNTLVEEKLVLQEARRLGLRVTPEDVDREWQRVDLEVRTRSNGARRLADVVERDFKMSERQFRDHLAQQILKEKVAGHPQHLGETLPKPKDASGRLAQTEVVIGEILRKARVRMGIATGRPEPAEALGTGVLALVNDEPIMAEELATALLDRLPATEVRDILEQECKAVLTQGHALSVAQMDDVIARERERWNTWREMTTQEAMRSVEYEDYVRMSYGLDLDTLKQDRYFRGYYGLIRDRREAVTPEDVAKEYEDHKTGLYGDAFLVTTIQIAFSGSNVLLRGGRDRRQALQLAQEILRKHHSGVPFDAIVREVNARQDRTVRAVRLRVRNTQNEQLLYERARIMEDGAVTMPFETLSEVHVLRRERAIPAPTFEEVEDLVRDSLARRRAHAWLEEQIQDPTKVRIHWPPPAR